MSKEISAEEVEILQEFVQETRDMIEHLEPTIIELEKSCGHVDCWAETKCNNPDCSRYGKILDTPCWLHRGYVGDGKGTCVVASSEQECLSCSVFRAINGDRETMNAIFRLFHSMKGSAGFLELTRISQVAHSAENLLDLIRSGKVMMEPGYGDLLCHACDFAKIALDYVLDNNSDEELSMEAGVISQRLAEAIKKATDRSLAIHSAEPPVASVPAVEDTSLPQEGRPAEEMESGNEEGADLRFEISPEMVQGFIQEADELLLGAEDGLLECEKKGGDPEVLATVFRSLHSFKGNCGFFGYADLEKLGHRIETVIDCARSGNGFGGLNVYGMLLQAVDVLHQGVVDISGGGTGRISGLDRHLKVVDEIIAQVEKDVSVTPTVVVENAVPVVSAAQEQKTVAADDEPARPAVSPSEKFVAAKKPAPGPQKKLAAATNGGAVVRQDLRVDLVKLDSLINLIGELVIAENMLIHNPDLAGIPLENFNKAAQQMDKIVRDLQEMAMIIRMIPVSGLFRKMIRLVHDLSLKSGKKVDLQLSGEETEIDKTVIETISDPLVHLLRNSLDHGLEPPAERLAAGKPETGVLRLSARHEEGEVWISVEDDGRGLNREKLLSKAISKGLIEENRSEISDREVYSLIFAPGFSTADKVTDISGRGVGMDVVKRNLEKIKGKIDVSSIPGKGTGIKLRIPLTLAIIDGMLIRVGSAKCIVPLLAIRDIFRPESGAITYTPEGQELVKVRGKFYPVLHLSTILDKGSERKDLNDGVLILVEHQGTGVSLFIDEVLGQQQTVIKGLSGYFAAARYVSGCTILGNGDVCLILDVGALVESEEMNTA